MHQFSVYFKSLDEVKQFVSVCSELDCSVFVGNDSYHVNGNSFMGMFTLDFSKPQQVVVNGSDGQIESFRQRLADFLQA